MTQARIERQAETVARLSRQLRFELLLLRRMRARSAERTTSTLGAPAFSSLAEVYAAALLRSGLRDGR